MPVHASVVQARSVMENKCARRVMTGFALGSAVGCAVGAVFGMLEAAGASASGAQKLRYVGRTTLTSSGMFGFFLAAGSLVQCGR
jgi:hypothetical protein